MDLHHILPRYDKVDRYQFGRGWEFVHFHWPEQSQLTWVWQYHATYDIYMHSAMIKYRSKIILNLTLVLNVFNWNNYHYWRCSEWFEQLRGWVSDWVASRGFSSWDRLIQCVWNVEWRRVSWSSHQRRLCNKHRQTPLRHCSKSRHKSRTTLHRWHLRLPRWSVSTFLVMQ